MNKCNLSVGFKLNKIACDEQPRTKERPFTIYHNGVDRASVINQRGEDITEYFNISIEHGIVVCDFKNPLSFDEWRKITGRI